MTTEMTQDARKKFLAMERLVMREGLPLSECAEKLAISRSTLSKWLARAPKEFQERVENIRRQSSLNMDAVVRRKKAERALPPSQA